MFWDAIQMLLMVGGYILFIIALVKNENLKDDVAFLEERNSRTMGDLHNCIQDARKCYVEVDELKRTNSMLINKQSD